MAGRESAGILLYRRAGDRVEVLIAHPGGPFWRNKDEGAWSIPKGETDGGEAPEAAALRELEEETGCRVDQEALVPLGSVRQRSGKLVRGWAAETDFDPQALRSNSFTMEWPPRSGRMQEFPEIDRVAWVAPDEAKRKLNPAQRAFVDRLLAMLEAGES